jgi:2-oxoglutarate ferredoxin oxidoreductase subunit beta
MQAFGRAIEEDKLPLGVFYINPDKKTFEENIGIYEKDDTPLFKRDADYKKLETLINKFI